MGKKSKQIGRENRNLIVNSNKASISQEKKEKLQARIAEITDEQLEKLFENGKITQSEYESILEYRKKLKKKKTDKEKFNERIRCNNLIIQKIVEIGRRFRREEITKRKYQENSREGYNDQAIEREERVRTKSDGQRLIERTRGSDGGRTHDR